MKTQTCEFISATEIIPSEYWEELSEDAPFSWGNNNRSLVTASDFANYCEERLEPTRPVNRFIKELRKLGEMYIDLES